MLASVPSAEQELVENLASFTLDPLGCALYSFPWGEPGELEDVFGPYDWQRDILEVIGDHLRGRNRFEPLKIAVSSGRGIGKSALIALVSHWALSTCEDTRLLVTANTEPQLATKTWPEISKWFRRSINNHWWAQTATRICAKGKSHADTWRIDRETWSENNIEAFRGLHNLGKRMVFIFDEAAGIPEVIWRATEGSLTDEGTEMIFLAFSNPSQNTGAFRECFGKLKHRWITRQIDSRKVPGTNKEEIRRWVEDWGEDSDYVRVNVKGEFPRAGSAQLISAEVVAAARNRIIPPEAYQSHWKVLSCDVARFGDDQTVIGMRQGPKFTILDKLRGLSTVQTSNRLMQRMKEHEPRTVVIDGDGIGGGVVDYVREYMTSWFAENPARKLMEFHGGLAPIDGFMYFNYRANMWGAMRDWLVTGDIPDDPEMGSDLTGPEYYFSAKNQIQLEKKEDMKKRGLSSPDLGDTLAMSFSAVTLGKTQEETDRDRLMATKSPSEHSLLQYKLTMDRDKRQKQAEERRPAHWD